MAIARARAMQRVNDEQEHKALVKEIVDELISRIKVDADISNAILNIKALKQELDNLGKQLRVKEKKSCQQHTPIREVLSSIVKQPSLTFSE